MNKMGSERMVQNKRRQTRGRGRTEGTDLHDTTTQKTPPPTSSPPHPYQLSQLHAELEACCKGLTVEKFSNASNAARAVLSRFLLELDKVVKEEDGKGLQGIRLFPELALRSGDSQGTVGTIDLLVILYREENIPCRVRRRETA